MKRIAIVGMILVLLALSITPVLADDETGNRIQHQYRFQLTGTVEEVDVNAGTITVSIIGYSSENPIISTRLTIQTNERTQFVYARQANVTETRPPTIEDVEVGEKIAVRGMVREQVHVATQVTLRLQLGTPIPTRTPQPTPNTFRFSLTGEVEKVDVDAGDIMVTVITYTSNRATTEWPERLVIHTNELTEFQWARSHNTVTPNPPTIEDVEVGDKIAVQGVIRDREHLATHVTLRFAQVTPPPEQKFALTGAVEGVDVDAGTITVSVITYYPPQTSETQPLLTIQTTEETRFAYAPPASATDPNAPTIKDVVVGEKIAVHGFLRDNVHIAVQVLLRPAHATPNPTCTADPPCTPNPSRTPDPQQTPGPWRTPTAQPQNVD